MNYDVKCCILYTYQMVDRLLLGSIKMSTKEYVIQLKTNVFALQHHIYKTECFSASCSNCRLHLACQQIIKIERAIKELEKYV